MPREEEDFLPENETPTNLTEKELKENINWEGGLELLKENWPTDDLKAVGDWEKMEYWLELAAAMHKFDPERFNKDVIITDSTCDIFYQRVNNIIRKLHSLKDPGSSEYHHNMFTLLEISAPLKELESEKFEQKVDMDDELWRKIADWINSTYGPLFIDLYEMAHTINPQKIAELLPIDGKNWPEIRKMVAESPVQMNFALKAQEIKPEGLPDIEVSQEEFMKWYKIMQNWFAHHRCDSLVFKFAKALIDKKVKVIN